MGDLVGRNIGPSLQRFIDKTCSFLEDQGPATANEIAHAFNMTPNTVRTWLYEMYHLGWLNRDKLHGNTWTYRYEPVRADNG